MENHGVRWLMSDESGAVHLYDEVVTDHTDLRGVVNELYGTLVTASVHLERDDITELQTSLTRDVLDKVRYARKFLRTLRRVVASGHKICGLVAPLELLRIVAEVLERLIRCIVRHITWI